MLRLAASESTLTQHAIWTAVGVTVATFQTVGKLADLLKERLSPTNDNNSQP